MRRSVRNGASLLRGDAPPVDHVDTLDAPRPGGIARDDDHSNAGAARHEHSCQKPDLCFGATGFLPRSGD